VVATSSDPRLGAIRLAWWRERLEVLEQGGSPPAEPRLQAVTADLTPRGVSGKELSQLEEAWLPLLEPFPWQDAQAEGLKLRGHILFGVGAGLLGGDPAAVAGAGALWSLVDGEHHCSNPQSREMLRQQAAALLAQGLAPIPSQLRVLTALAALAAADMVREGSGLKRLSGVVRHRLTGSFPRS
jgi:phytoene synthase